MLRSLDELTGYTLLASDGEIGRTKDFLFDDRTWTVRYLVADTGKWLPGRHVLISPAFLGEPDRIEKHVPVDLTRKAIESSPPLHANAPVSRQKERELLAYYHLQPYWVGPHLWGPYPTPAMPPPHEQNEQNEQATPDASENTTTEAKGASSDHLRSTDEVSGYHVAASDQEIGHVEDFVTDTGTWAVRWLVIDTRNWLPGRKVLVSPAWVESVRWSDAKLEVDLTAEQIENSPRFDPSEPINVDPAYQNRLYDYYGRRQAPR